jgi:hypothetical protein
MRTSTLKCERARENRAYVRKLLREREPEFAAALASVEREFSCPAAQATDEIAVMIAQRIYQS